MAELHDDKPIGETDLCWCFFSWGLTVCRVLGTGALCICYRFRARARLRLVCHGNYEVCRVFEPENPGHLVVISKMRNIDLYCRSVYKVLNDFISVVAMSSR